MAKADIKILVDWNNDGNFTHANSDITSDAIDVAWDRGRDYASQLSGNSKSGKLSATLYNTSGKYSPNNASSPITGKIEPGLRIKVLGGAASAFPYTFPIVFTDTNPLWTGYLQEIRPEPSSKGAKRAKLVAFGVLGYLNDFRIDLATQSSVRTDQAIGAILDDAGLASGDRTLATGLTTMARFWVDGMKTINALRIPEETEGGFIKESKDAKVVFESRHTRLSGDYLTSQATFSDASGASLSYKQIDQIDPLSTIVNHTEATTRTYTVGSVAVLWTLGETGAESPEIAPGESRTFEARYPNPDSDNNAVEVNAWTTSASSTDYTANSASGGGGTDLTSSLGVANTKIAQRMIITITNNHASTNAFLTKLQARGTAVTQKQATVRSIDTTSQAKYGERKFVAETEFIPNTTEAQRWCEFQLSIYSTPVNILKMSYVASLSAGLIHQAITRDISDRVTVTANNDSELGINADFFIESERHSVNGNTHLVSYSLSPASGGYSQFWVLGVSKLNENTVPAY